MRYRSGAIKLDETVITNEVFKNASKGDRPKAGAIEEAFPGLSRNKILHEIITKGGYNMNAAERKEATTTKRREIVEYIHKSYVDAKKFPHPVVRIEMAMNKINPKISLEESAERQSQPIINKMKDLMPMIKKEEMRGMLRVPHEYVGSVKGVLKKWATLEREKYDDGEGFSYSISFLPSNYDSLMADINTKTNGESTFDIL